MVLPLQCRCFNEMKLNITQTNVSFALRFFDFLHVHPHILLWWVPQLEKNKIYN